jgi:hypothetical protein
MNPSSPRARIHVTWKELEQLSVIRASERCSGSLVWDHHPVLVRKILGDVLFDEIQRKIGAMPFAEEGLPELVPHLPGRLPALRVEDAA